MPTISWIPEAAIRFKCDSEEEVHGVKAREPGVDGEFEFMRLLVFGIGRDSAFASSSS